MELFEIWEMGKWGQLPIISSRSAARKSHVVLGTKHLPGMGRDHHHSGLLDLGVPHKPGLGAAYWANAPDSEGSAFGIWAGSRLPSGRPPAGHPSICRGNLPRLRRVRRHRPDIRFRGKLFVACWSSAWSPACLPAGSIGFTRFACWEPQS